MSNSKVVSELKPCPFCGGTAAKYLTYGNERDGYADHVTYSCVKCHCTRGASGDSSKGGYADNSKVESEALLRWNTRVPAENVQAQRQVVMPERTGESTRGNGWNACLDEFKRLNK